MTRNLYLAKVRNQNRKRDLWACNASQPHVGGKCRQTTIQRCADCGAQFHRHHWEARASRCQPCLDYRAGKINATAWNTIMVDGPDSLLASYEAALIMADLYAPYPDDAKAIRCADCGLASRNPGVDFSDWNAETDKPAEILCGDCWAKREAL
jgi:hypothetical protein